jgi:hypothetical protein
VRSLAYLDGNTGSLIASALVGGGAAVVLFVKLGWQRFLGIFSSTRRARYEAMRAERAATSSDDDAAEHDSTPGPSAPERSDSTSVG